MGHEPHGRRYLRAKTKISSDKDGDISGQKRRYPPAKPYNGPTDKVHIGYNSANGYFTYNQWHYIGQRHYQQRERYKFFRLAKCRNLFAANLHRDSPKEPKIAQDNLRFKACINEIRHPDSHLSA